MLHENLYYIFSLLWHITLVWILKTLPNSLPPFHVSTFSVNPCPRTERPTSGCVFTKGVGARMGKIQSHKSSQCYFLTQTQHLEPSFLSYLFQSKDYKEGRRCSDRGTLGEGTDTVVPFVVGILNEDMTDVRGERIPISKSLNQSRKLGSKEDPLPLTLWRSVMTLPNYLIPPYSRTHHVLCGWV